MSSPENSASDDGKDDELNKRASSGLDVAGHLLKSKASGKSSVFQDSLLMDFEEAGRQAGAGVYWMKRVAMLMKKYAILEAQFAKEVFKLVDHEIEKASATSEKTRVQFKDHMPRAWNAVQSFHSSIKEMAQNHLDHSKAMASCAKPVKYFFKATHGKLNKTLIKLDQSSKIILQSREKIAKNRLKVLAAHDTAGKSRTKALKSAISSSFILDKVSDLNQHQGSAMLASTQGGVLSRMLSIGLASPPTPNSHSEKKDELSRSRADSTINSDDKTTSLAKEYMKQVDQINTAQDKFITEELTEALNFFESTERARIEIMQSQLSLMTASFSHLKGGCDSTMEKLNTQLSNINIEADLHTFANYVEKTRVNKINLQRMDYDLHFVKENAALPPSAQLSSKNSSSDVQSVFSMSLSDIMERERAVDPSIKVPRIYSTLLEAIKQNGGLKTEGIFRISAGKGDLEDLRAKIIAGNYAIGVKDPHVSAGLLKEWLRGLPEPLFPHSVYQECLQISRDDCQDMATYINLVNKLPEVNRSIIHELVELILEFTRPENVAVSKMNIRNMAVVFAPSFLRYKGNDPMMMMKNNVLELQFVVNLVNLYRPTEFRAAADNEEKPPPHMRSTSTDVISRYDDLIASESTADVISDGKEDGDELGKLKSSSREGSGRLDPWRSESTGPMNFRLSMDERNSIDNSIEPETTPSVSASKDD